MSKDKGVLYADLSELGVARVRQAIADLSPPFNFYTGRNTSVFALVDFEPSRTSQEFAAESDINLIMARFLKTGTIPVYADRQPFYVDAADLPSFQDMQNILISADEAFGNLPAALRERFGNDAARFVEFVSDPANEQELRKLGLLSPEAVERLDAADAAKAAAQAADRLAAADKPPQAPSTVDKRPM